MKVRTYEEAEEFLNDVPRFTKKNPLEETKEFYNYLQSEETGSDYKEERLGKIVHVAGTNGKGSVCAYMDSIFRESGYHVGLFTSPHLITTRERFVIDGHKVSEEQFMEAFYWLEDKILNYKNKRKAEYEPTYFERLFFMGIYLFSKAGVDISIMETGLGGRLDTTNVIEKPSICVITEIGFDHMAYLGNTLEAIAGEKAGIIKENVPVVFSDRRKETSDVLEQKAAKEGAFCHKVLKNEYKINEIRKKSIDFSLYSSYYDYIDLTVNTRAIYQVENAAVAVRAAEVLKNKEVLDKVTKESIALGVEKMHWPGRMEEILPNVYIDGAHNEDGIDAFVNTLISDKAICESNDKCYLIFSAVNDKKYDNMIKMLTGIPYITDYCVTRIPGHRGVDIHALKQQFEINTDKNIHVFDEIQDAFDYCMLNKEEGDMVYIVGSLYLAGLVEDLVQHRKGHDIK